MIQRNELTKFFDELLNPELFSDYGPNGLQIEGKEEIRKIAFAVSATKDSVEKAVAWGADALFVHHGLFWKFHGPRAIAGAFAKRVKPLIQNDINLYGYHLPLDAHIEFGNAAALAKQLGLSNLEAFGERKGAPLGVKGSFPTPLASADLKVKMEALLQRQVIHSRPDDRPISTMGIITGGANSEWVEAQKDGLDAYLTGEISEHDWHEAQEGGVHYFAGGHHATERFGPLAVMEHLRQTKGKGLELTFLDSPNPA